MDDNGLNGELNGRTVLVVEDEYFLADDIRHGLAAAGAIVLGPFASVPEALGVIDETRPDVAVLDINLRGLAVFEVAETLAARGVPFVFATGYDEKRIPPQFRAAPKLLKPYELPSLLAALKALAARP